MVMGIYKCFQASHLISACVRLQFLRVRLSTLRAFVTPSFLFVSLAVSRHRSSSSSVEPFCQRNFPSSEGGSHIIGLLFPAYHCCSSQKTPDPIDISSRSRETTFSREDHRFQFSSVNLPCLRGIIVHRVH